MTRLMRRRGQKGFTLIELLIVVAIIGIIAAILIPNLLDALQKAKQKRTVADMRNVGSAWFAWLTDQVSAASAGAVSTTYDVTGGSMEKTTHSAVESALVNRYIQRLPDTDAWDNELEFYKDSDNLADQVMAIRSPGRNGTFTGTNYTIGPFTATNYDEDIVWADGFFVAYPEGTQSSS